MIESKGMQMHLVNTDDSETVKSKYINVIKNTPDIEKYARWIYGKHPTDETLKEYIDRGEMYVLMDGEEIAGMTAIAHQEESLCRDLLIPETFIMYRTLQNDKTALSAF